MEKNTTGNQPFKLINMSLETTLRYEDNQRLVKQDNLLKQHERIRFDELTDQQIQCLKNDFKTNLKSKWTEDMEKTRQLALWKANRIVVQDEINAAHRALLKVRRAKLKMLLNEEKIEENSRLASSGLTKYESRV